MLRRAAVVAAVLALAGCGARRIVPGQDRVRSGLDALEASGFAALKGKRVGVITNHTGRNRDGRPVAEVLAEAPGVELMSVFSPEHGFAGASEEFIVQSGTLRLAGREIPVHSLYGGGIHTMRPTQDQLAGLDAIVFDIQDIGARFYTYLATMGMALEEAQKAGIELVVLDRPNPITGTIVEGPMLDDLGLRKITPTAYFPVPVRHGLTAGEMALLYNAELKHDKLTIVKLEGWKRALWYDQTGLPWIPPSPNMPDLEAAALYPGVGLFEASNLSVGRGTPVPFRWIGAPWIGNPEAIAKDLNAALLEGIEFTAERFTPTKSVFKGSPCGGIRMKVTDRERLRPLAVFRRLHEILREHHPQEFEWKWTEVKKMTGTDEFQRIDERGGDRTKYQALFERGAERFEETRKLFLLYD